jgi:hypothetical protein
MGDLLNAFRKAGLVSEQQVAVTQAQEQLDAEAAAKKKLKEVGERDRRFLILQTTNSVSTFRLEAHKLLLEHPDQLGDVIKILHDRRLNTNRDGGRKLTSDLLNLRGHMGDDVPLSQRADLVRQYLPKKE